jgi:hypothetical protein
MPLILVRHVHHLIRRTEFCSVAGGMQPETELSLSMYVQELFVILEVQDEFLGHLNLDLVWPFVTVN